MTGPSTVEDVLTQLQQLLDDKTLPAPAKKTVRHLTERLSLPVRVTIFGPPGVGKSALRSIIAGEILIGEDLKIPTSDLRFAESPKISVTLGNGEQQDFEGLDFEAAASLSPAFLEVFAPLPALKKMSLLEIVTDGSRQEMQAAARWAAKRTDIAIWVTRELDHDEQAVWAKIPDGLKDHGYLVKCDFDTDSSTDRAHWSDEKSEFATEEFHRFIPVSMPSGPIEPGDDNANDEKNRSGGGIALLKALDQHINLGTQADIDSALLFLAKHNDADTGVGVPQPAGADARDPKPSALDDVLSGPVQAGNEPQKQSETDALICLESSAQAMLSELNFGEPSISNLVLDRCMDAIETVTDEMSDKSSVFDLAMQAKDGLVLMQIENVDTAAEDAVVTLLQFKRQLEVAQAA